MRLSVSKIGLIALAAFAGIAIAAEDNLVKGASGQMIQAANILLELPETTGLPLLGVQP